MTVHAWESPIYKWGISAVLCVLGRILCAFLQDGPRGLLLQVGTRTREREWLQNCSAKMLVSIMSWSPNQAIKLLCKGFFYFLGVWLLYFFASSAFMFNVRLLSLFFFIPLLSFFMLYFLRESRGILSRHLSWFCVQLLSNFFLLLAKLPGTFSEGAHRKDFLHHTTHKMPSPPWMSRATAFGWPYLDATMSRTTSSMSALNAM